MPGNEGEFAPGAGEGFYPGMNPAAVNPNNPSFPIPNGEFDLRQLTGDVVGWAHDDTVEPGKTYRYSVVYRVRNPIFNTVNVAKAQDLAARFDIVSTASDPSAEVVVPSLTNFYIAAGFSASSSRNVRVEIFRFQGGVMQSQTFTVAPGDSIGGKDTARNIDFATGWTLVDIRSDSANANNSYVLVAGPGGQLERRTFNAADGEWNRLRQQVQQAAATGAPGN
jgi:hypothetical protein